MKKYKKEYDYSYTSGIFPSMELIHKKPNLVFKIVISSKLENEDIKKELIEFSKQRNIELETNDNTINKLSEKENCYLIVFFKKESIELDKNNSHIVLVNPSNIGNIGNIIRTSLGFNFNNIAIITPSVDVMDPKSIRASMGAIFSTNVEHFATFEDYERKYKSHVVYPFVLKGKSSLQDLNKRAELCSLVFGNESSGLPDEFLKYENTVLIKHTNNIDSLNLTIAIGIALYEFTKDDFS
jgi:rRNA methylases